MENYVNHVTYSGNTERYISNRVQYSYSSVIPSWARINPDESHFCDVSSDHGWGLQDCPLLHVRVTSDALY